jgi:hypothetical protein
MRDLITFGSQVMVLFLFTPVCILARYAGQAVDLRRANAERQASMREFGIDHVEWRAAGEVTLDETGSLRMPDLPAVPGLRRLEFVGGLYAGTRSVSITGTRDLHELTCGHRPGRQFADDDTRSHLRSGGTIRVSYIDAIASRDGEFDLSDGVKRRRVVDFMRREVEIEAGRAA